MRKDALNVLFLNSWYPNRNAPTLGNFVQKHAEAVARFEHVICLSIFPDKSIQSIQTESDDSNGFYSLTIYFPEVKSKVPFVKHFLKWRSYRRAFETGMLQVRKQFNHIDIVHLNVVHPLGVFARMLKRNYQIPYVVTEHSTAYHQAETRFGKAQYRLIQAVLNEAHLILPVSEDLGKAIQKMTTRPTQRITNVVDPEVFIPAEKSAIFTLVHISTLNQEHKNPKGILRAVKALLEEGANLRLILISDFPADEVKRYATELTISSEHLSFLGPLNTIEVAQQLAEANALILFSNYENFPCVIAEAFMCGVPVISSRVNGIPEFVNESNGILVEAQDENALKEAIRTTLENRLQIDPAELRNYAISHFSYDAIGRQFSDVYRKTIQECGVK